jgi:hypothetical protein
MNTYDFIASSYSISNTVNHASHTHTHTFCFYTVANSFWAFMFEDDEDDDDDAAAEPLSKS